MYVLWLSAFPGVTSKVVSTLLTESKEGEGVGIAYIKAELTK